MEKYKSPKLTELGTVADLTKGAGTDTPEGQGSTFPIPAPSDRRLKTDIRPL